MFRDVIARSLSIIGHPAVVMPGTVLGLAATRAAKPGEARFAVALTLVVAVMVVGYCLWQVRAGRWKDSDASQPAERTQLNTRLFALLGITAVVLAVTAQPRELIGGAALSATLVAVALVLQRWLKLSLHTGFACLAATLVWPQPTAVVLMALFAAAIAWSRSVLDRHSERDLAAGAAAGFAAGVVLRLLTSTSGA